VIEALVCPSAIVALLIFFRDRLNVVSPGWRLVAANSYGAYVLHALVLVGLSLLLRNVPLHPLVKIVMVGIPGVILSLWLSEYVLRRIPKVGALFS
jgi:surface polysaccharide O-acyltransferase-like enzyme